MKIFENSPYFYFDKVTEFSCDMFWEMIGKSYLWILLLLAIHYSILAMLFIICWVLNESLDIYIVIIMIKFLQWRFFSTACFKHSFIEIVRNLSQKALTDSESLLYQFIFSWCPWNTSQTTFAIRVVLCFQNSLTLPFLTFHTIPQPTSVCSS